MGPSIRSAKTVSMMACRRWVMSASVAVSVVSVKNGWYRQIGNRGAVGLVGVFDAAHDQSGGDRLVGAGCGHGVFGFGDFGIGYPCPGLGIGHRAGVFHRGPGILRDGC